MGRAIKHGVIQSFWVRATDSASTGCRGSKLNSFLTYTTTCGAQLINQSLFYSSLVAKAMERLNDLVDANREPPFAVPATADAFTECSVSANSYSHY